jgi:hypothetical protein
MHSSSLQKNNHSRSKKTSKDIRRHAPTSPKAPSLKKRASPLSRTLSRYTKRGARAMLLSPVFHSAVRVVSAVAIVSLLAYASYFFIGKTFANEVVVSQSEIIARVSKLTMLPPEAPYDVVRVQDGEELRKQNPFYKDIKEGDYILMYRDMAVIYDLRNNVVKGVRRPGDR